MENNNKNWVMTTDSGDEVTLTNPHNHPRTYFTSVLGYDVTNVGYWDKYIDKDVLDSDFSPIERFKTIKLNKQTDKTYPFYPYYEQKELGFVIQISDNISKHEDYYMSDRRDDVSELKFKLISIYNEKLKEGHLNNISTYLNSVLKSIEDMSATITLVLKTLSGFEFKSFPINPLDLDINTMYNDDFKEVNSTIVDNLKDGNKGIIMLHGTPGTGKTNYIRNLTIEVPHKKFIFIPTNMISSLTSPDFISELIDNGGNILVLEDCEKYIESRSDSSNNDVVSSILNMSDGILSDLLKIQIICTFNSELNIVDEALQRKGRLLAEYKFEALSIEKTNKLLDSLGCEKAEEPLTISEIFNYKRNTHRVENNRNKIGFR